MNKPKNILHQVCLENIDKKLAQCENQMQSLMNSLSSETKSSAGDKHETGRAMIQLKREQLGQQYAQLEIEKNTLTKINIMSKGDKIQLGNVVMTNQHNYFLAISIGKITMDGLSFYAISAKSPIGKLLIGKNVGDVINFRNQKIEIIDFY